MVDAGHPQQAERHFLLLFGNRRGEIAGRDTANQEKVQPRDAAEKPQPRRTEPPALVLGHQQQPQDHGDKKAPRQMRPQQPRVFAQRTVEKQPVFTFEDDEANVALEKVIPFAIAKRDRRGLDA